MNLIRSTSRRIGDRVGVPAIVIEAIVLAIMQTIVWCLTEPTPEEVAHAAKNPRRRQLKAMRHVVEDQLERTGHETKAAATLRAIREEIEIMSVDDFRQVMIDAQDGTRDYQ